MVTKNNMLSHFDLRSSVFGTVLVCLLVGLLGGCVTSAELTETQRENLEQRVRDRWQALEDRDFEKAWEYTSPNYRAIFSKQLYAKKFSYAVEWESK